MSQRRVRGVQKGAPRVGSGAGVEGRAPHLVRTPSDGGLAHHFRVIRADSETPPVPGGAYGSPVPFKAPPPTSAATAAATAAAAAAAAAANGPGARVATGHRPGVTKVTLKRRRRVKASKPRSAAADPTAPEPKRHKPLEPTATAPTASAPTATAPTATAPTAPAPTASASAPPLELSFVADDYEPTTTAQQPQLQQPILVNPTPAATPATATAKPARGPTKRITSRAARLRAAAHGSGRRKRPATSSSTATTTTTAATALPAVQTVHKRIPIALRSSSAAQQRGPAIVAVPKRRFVASELNDLYTLFTEMEASMGAMMLQRSRTSFELGAIATRTRKLTPQRFAQIVSLAPSLYTNIVRRDPGLRNVSGIEFSLGGPSKPRIRRDLFTQALTVLDKAVAVGGPSAYPAGMAGALASRLEALPSPVRHTLFIGAAPVTQTQSLKPVSAPASAFSALRRLSGSKRHPRIDLYGDSASASAAAAAAAAEPPKKLSLAERIAAREKANLASANAARKTSLFSATRLAQLARFLIYKFGAAKSSLPLKTAIDGAIHTFRNQHSVRYESSSMSKLLTQLIDALPPDTLTITVLSGLQYLRILSKPSLRAYAASSTSS